MKDPYDDRLNLLRFADEVPPVLDDWFQLPQNGDGRRALESVLQGCKRMVVVGNGPVHPPRGEAIDKYPTVTRMNHYSKDVKTVGKKVDLYVTNIQDFNTSIVAEEKETYALGQTPTIVAECKYGGAPDVNYESAVLADGYTFP